MSGAALNANYCATLVDEWVHQGLRHAVLAPGSRSAPLALALVRDGRVEVQVVLDERSAAFVALGIGRATGRAALVLCTSGTAATHLHGAVAEAAYSGVPLLAVTADRPPELQGIGAAQTIDQREIFGPAVRASCDPGPPEPGGEQSWRALATRAWAAASNVPRGPVHVNLALREPLVGERGVAVGAPGALAAHVHPAVDAAIVDDVAKMVGAHERGVIVAGWGAGVAPASLDQLAAATGWPVLADAISNARDGAHVVGRYEALVRVPALADELRPDAVLRFGAALTSKVVTQWLAPVAPHVVIDGIGLPIDPTRSATARHVCDPEAFARAVAGAIARDTGNAAYRQRWLELDRTAGAAIGDVLDGVIAPSGPQVARDVARALPGGAELVVASSMPVRDLEWFAGSFGGVTVHANRGVNGIDGTIATATGVAIGTRAPTVVLLGDLAFLHDAGSLLGLAGRGVDLTIVVADNDGGGIFSFLDQRSDSPHDEFERLFGTPHGIDLVELARGYRIDARRVHDAAAVRDALASAIADGNVHVIVVPVLDRDADVAHHRDLWAAAAAATAIAPTTGRVSGG